MVNVGNDVMIAMREKANSSNNSNRVRLRRRRRLRHRVRHRESKVRLKLLVIRSNKVMDVVSLGLMNSSHNKNLKRYIHTEVPLLNVLSINLISSMIVITREIIGGVTIVTMIAGITVGKTTDVVMIGVMTVAMTVAVTAAVTAVMTAAMIVDVGMTVAAVVAAAVEVIEEIVIDRIPVMIADNKEVIGMVIEEEVTEEDATTIAARIVAITMVLVKQSPRRGSNTKAISGKIKGGLVEDVDAGAEGIGRDR